jgi:hypothetical protein
VRKRRVHLPQPCSSAEAHRTRFDARWKRFEVRAGRLSVTRPREKAIPGASIRIAKVTAGKPVRRDHDPHLPAVASDVADARLA